MLLFLPVHSCLRQDLLFKFLLVQVFDLQTIQPPDFVAYGLACLEQMAAQGDACAKDTREKLRIVVCYFDSKLSLTDNLSL